MNQVSKICFPPGDDDFRKGHNSSHKCPLGAVREVFGELEHSKQPPGLLRPTNFGKAAYLLLYIPTEAGYDGVIVIIISKDRSPLPDLVINITKGAQP